MDSEKFIPLFLAFVVGVILVGAVFVPVATSSTTRTIEREEVFNEGAEWLKFGYGQGNSLNFGFMPIYSEDTLTIGSQTGIDEDMILYADDDCTLISYGDYLYLIMPDSVHRFDKGTDLSVNVQNGSGSVIVHGIPTYQLSPSWAYYPDSMGNYGFFYDGGLNLETGKPTVAVGTYAQAFAYNDNPVMDLYGVVVDMVKSGSPSDSVTWVKDTSSVADEIQEIGPLTPLDPSIIQPIDLNDPEPDVTIQNVDPDYSTRIGDLYYTFTGNSATVVGYSASTDFAALTTIPDTVVNNGVTYTVTSIGDRAFYECTNLALTSLPSGLTNIGQNAFRSCTNLALTFLPSGVTTLGSACFYGCTNLALTSLPSGITAIPNYAFESCTNLALTSLPSGVTSIGIAPFQDCTNLALTSLPSGLTSIRGNAFYGCENIKLITLPINVTIDTYSFYDCSGMESLIIQEGFTFSGSDNFKDTNITEILNLRGRSITPSYMGIQSATVQDYIGALGYIAPTSFVDTETVMVGGATSVLIQLLPLVAGLGLLLMAVGTMIYRRV